MFKLKGNVIPGPVDITDINDIGVSGRALVCESERTTSQSPSLSSMGNWYLHPESQSTHMDDKLGGSERGWIRTRATTTAGYRQVKLKRQSPTGAVEGKFTCEIQNDIIPINSLFVLYPSEL